MTVLEANNNTNGDRERLNINRTPLNLASLIRNVNINDSKMEKINTINGIKLNTRYLISDKDSNLLVLNIDENAIYKLNTYFKLIKKYDIKLTHSINLQARGICVNDKNDLFITNISTNKVLKYTINDGIQYKYAGEFGDVGFNENYEKSLNKLDSPRGIECYATNLYVCDYNNKRICIFNQNTFDYVNSIFIRNDDNLLNDNEINEAFYPYNVKIKQNNIFVTDLTSSIRIFDLDTLDIIFTIRDSDIIEPKGLLVDNELNIYTTSFSRKDQISYLYCFDVNGTYLRRVSLLSNNVIFDIEIVKNYLHNDVYLYVSLGPEGILKVNMS